MLAGFTPATTGTAPSAVARTPRSGSRPTPRCSCLGATLGMLGVLHTWTRALEYHPHVHYLVPGGGLSLDQRQWVKSRPQFLLPVKALSDRCRNLFREALQKQMPQALAELPPQVWEQRWVVHSAAVGSGQNALRYLSRYVFKTATGNRQLQLLPNGRLRWPFRHSGTGGWRHIELEPGAVIEKGALAHALVRLRPNLGRKITSHGLRAFYVTIRRSHGILDSQIAYEIGHTSGGPPRRRYMAACRRTGLLATALAFSGFHKVLQPGQHSRMHSVPPEPALRATNSSLGFSIRRDLPLALRSIAEKSVDVVFQSPFSVLIETSIKGGSGAAWLPR